MALASIIHNEMNVEVEVLSREFIKPSSPTPHHLQNHQFSFLDQLAPQVYMPYIFFYESNPNFSNAEKSHRLKTSLSRTLMNFYPLAGRLIGNSSINCNDEGVLFVEALHVESQFSEAMENPNLGDHNKFLPLPTLGQWHNNIVLAIQVNFFKCGGLAIGVCTYHMVGDALSLFTFIDSWAASTLHGDQHHDGIVSPSFDTAKLFPPRAISRSWEIREDYIVSKRFVFHKSALESLRAKYSEGKEFRASRVEALSSFIWNRYYEVVSKPKSNLENHQVHLVLHAVNIRNSIEPPLPKSTCGNVFRMAVSLPYNKNSDQVVCHDLARRMRAATKKLDGVYVKKIQGGGEDDNLKLMKEAAKRFTKGKVVSFHFTSWCGMPLYETDFGWGKPLRVGSARLPLKNLVGFVDTRNGDGIEAFISLEKQDMATFEVDNEFLSYVKPASPQIPMVYAKQLHSNL